LHSLKHIDQCMVNTIYIDFQIKSYTQLLLPIYAN